MNVEARAGSTFTYDFRDDSDVAAISYGFDVSDPANFALQTNNELIQRNIVNRENTPRGSTWNGTTTVPASRLVQ